MVSVERERATSELTAMLPWIPGAREFVQPHRAKDKMASATQEARPRRIAKNELEAFIGVHCLPWGLHFS